MLLAPRHAATASHRSSVRNGNVLYAPLESSLRKRTRWSRSPTRGGGPPVHPGYHGGLTRPWQSQHGLANQLSHQRTVLSAHAVRASKITPSSARNRGPCHRPQWHLARFSRSDFLCRLLVERLQPADARNRRRISSLRWSSCCSKLARVSHISAHCHIGSVPLRGNCPIKESPEPSRQPTNYLDKPTETTMSRRSNIFFGTNTSRTCGGKHPQDKPHRIQHTLPLQPGRHSPTHSGSVTEAILPSSAESVTTPSQFASTAHCKPGWSGCAEVESSDAHELE